MKILFAADGSEYTTRAAYFLVAHLEWFRMTPELHLLNVRLPIPKGLALAQAESLLGRDTVSAYYEDAAKAALSKASKIFSEHRITFHASHRVGDVAAAICAYAAEHGIEMIVMGSHGHGALKNLVLGSVAMKVLAMESDIPVMIVR